MEDTPNSLFYRRRLPHWRTEGAVYFVTWRVLRGQPDLEAAEQTLVLGAIRYFDGDRYDLLAAVVMNDHVHVLVLPREPYGLNKIMHSWKSFTAHSLQRVGRRGAVWQAESFDRIVRSEPDFVEKANYILENPSKRWPHLAGYEWTHCK